jgi:hypothetical protein
MKIIKKWDKCEEKRNKLKKKLLKTAEIKGKGIVMAFITFDTIAERDFILSEFSYSPMAWFFYSCCCCCCKDKKRAFHQKLLGVEPAPEPEGIRWENLEKNDVN